MALDKIGRYVIQKEIGRGGMATVYLARDPNFDRDVAIKVLPSQYLHDPLFRDRFDREAKTVAALEHFAIVPVYDFGQQEEMPYLVMRYMTGGSLSERILGGPMNVDDSALVMSRIGAALDEAHLRGVIHRDLKPANILFDRYGEAHLSDFGIAKLSEVTAALTGSAVIGTPAYMSPEQAYGNDEIDGRSDIYSLGVILFEMLTGEMPYEANTPMGVAMKHILDPVPNILEVNPDLPEGIDSIIKRALAKHPNDRYPTAVQMAENIEAVSNGKTITMPEVPVREPTRYSTPDLSEITVVSQTQQVSGMKAAPKTRVMRKPSAVPPPSPTEAGVSTDRQPRRALRQMRQPKRRSRPFLTILLFLILLLLLSVLSEPYWRPFVGQRVPEIRSLLPIPAADRVTYDVAQALGDVDELDVSLEIGYANVEIYSLVDSSNAVEGSYRVGEDHGSLGLTYREASGSGDLEIFQDSLFDPFEAASLELGITDAVPVNLALVVDAGELTVDLKGLQVESLRIEGNGGRYDITLPSQARSLVVDIESGGGEFIIRLPDDDAGLNLESFKVVGMAGSIYIELPGHGSYEVQTTAGVGGVTIKVPDEIEASVTLDGLATLDFRNDRFEETDMGDWVTAGYEESTSRADIQVTNLLGSLVIDD
jgi:serine/threonine-protein kinase